MYSRIILCLPMLMLGCGTQEYSQCEPHDGNLKIMYKPEIDVVPMSHPFCIVCNPTLDATEYESWALTMGATQLPSSYEGVHPCLYVYTNSNDSIDSVEECTALVCDGGAVYSDMVGSNNGNFDLSPILENP